jgi:Icc protein
LTTAIAESVPDAIVASGDIAQDGEPEAYAAFMRSVRAVFDGPVLCTPGNHDLTGPMIAAGLPMAPLHFGQWQIVALDSHEDGRIGACVTDAAVAGCFATFDAPHVLLCTHHHLLPVACPWLDDDCITSAFLHGRLASPSPVRAVIFGHVHQAVEHRIGAVPLLGTPSTCFQALPGSARFTLDRAAPGYRRIRLHDDGTISTVVRRAPDLPEPPRIVHIGS